MGERLTVSSWGLVASLRMCLPRIFQRPRSIPNTGCVCSGHYCSLQIHLPLLAVGTGLKCVAMVTCVPGWGYKSTFRQPQTCIEKFPQKADQWFPGTPLMTCRTGGGATEGGRGRGRGLHPGQWDGFPIREGASHTNCLPIHPFQSDWDLDTVSYSRQQYMCCDTLRSRLSSPSPEGRCT